MTARVVSVANAERGAPGGGGSAGLRGLLGAWARLRARVGPGARNASLEPSALEIAYPTERGLPEEAQRGVPVLVADADGGLRCTSCDACAAACPAACITLSPGPAGRAPARFEIELGSCLFCGVCEAVCPEVAIVMSPEFECAAYRPEELRLDREALRVPASAVEGRIRFVEELRASGEAPAGPTG